MKCEKFKRFCCFCLPPICVKERKRVEDVEECGERKMFAVDLMWIDWFASALTIKETMDELDFVRFAINNFNVEAARENDVSLGELRWIESRLVERLREEKSGDTKESGRDDGRGVEGRVAEGKRSESGSRESQESGGEAEEGEFV